jgi:carboxypeptidase Taq
MSALPQTAPPEPPPPLAALKRRLLEVDDLESAGAVLGWDQSTYMPPGGADARGRQLATLSALAHQKLTDPETGRLLDALRGYEESLPPDADDASLIRVARRDYQRAVRVPAAFMAELARHGAASFQAWTVARPGDDFAAVRPLLEQTVDYSRQLAGFFPGYAHIADPLIDLADEGVTAADVRALFAALRAELVPIARAITALPPADDACLRQHYPAPSQIAFGEETIRRYGFDFERGRQDKTHHPFTTRFAAGDVRITTRINEGDLREGLFATLHEAGHALYEQGIRPELEGTPLGRGTSSGIHESQSRLWENLVGRSLPFWEHTYPRLQQVFPDQLGAVPLDTFYRAVNKVERSLIRVEADEVTYNLHVMIRFDLELDLLEGTLAVRDLPEAWRERYRADLGVAPPDDRDGVLQDMHWYAGQVGGLFQGYTLGNVIGAQLYAAALAARPEIATGVAGGQFDALRGWLTEQIYQHGRKLTTAELLQRATGGPLSTGPYLDYLRRKYGALYSLPPA